MFHINQFIISKSDLGAIVQNSFWNYNYRRKEIDGFFVLLR